MRKKVLSLIVVLATALALCVSPALAEAPAMSGTVGENIKWEYDFTVTPNTITFSGTGPMEDYDAFGMNHGWNRFSNTAVMIGAGITHVGDRAFGTGSCTSAVIAATVESIGSFAFSNCKSLTAVTIENPDITIAESAFNGCEGITSFVVGGTDYGTPEAYLEEVSSPSIPEPVTKYEHPAGDTTVDKDDVPSRATLETVVLPEGVTAIGNSAFIGCTNLKSVTLPTTLTAIGDFAFQDCKALETVVLPEGVAVIGSSAFIDCVKLKSVTLPSTLTTIGGSAFQGCASLAEIQLPESLETLGDEAFRGCASLASITIPKGITSMGMGTFAECTNLTRVTLSQGLTAIGASAFYNCPGLTSVTIPDSVTSIGNYAFRATGLTGVTIPQSVTYLGECPFGVTKDFTWVTNFTITGYAGTEAETYAKDIGFPFVDLTPPLSSSSSPSRHTHRWDDGVVTLEPTALTGGLRTYTCKGCGATKTESISAGYADPVTGDTVVITGIADSGGRRVISSVGINPAARGGQAYASTQSVKVDGAPVEFEMYALKDQQGNVTNYVKLRDVALILNGTGVQCDVDWVDNCVTVTTQTPYKPNGSEMKTPFAGDRRYSAANSITRIDGEEVLMQAFILEDDNGGGYTYYKLRDLGQALGFYVGWTQADGVFIDTSKPYSE